GDGARRGSRRRPTRTTPIARPAGGPRCRRSPRRARPRTRVLSSVTWCGPSITGRRLSATRIVPCRPNRRLCFPPLRVRACRLAAWVGAAAPAAEPTRLVLLTWGSRFEEDVNRRLVQAFEASHPGIAVELRVQPSLYEEKVRTLLAADLLPDVLYVGS